MKKQILSNLVTLLLLIATLHAQDVINPVSATTTLNAQIGSSLANAYNGVGLDAFPSLKATHEATTSLNSFLAKNESGSIDFDLGGSYLVQGFSLWNEIAYGFETTGVKEVVVSFSEDGANYTPIIGAPTSFAQELSSTNPFGSFTFTPVTASYIRFEIISNYGDRSNLLVLSEVAFSGTMVVGANDKIVLDEISFYPNPATEMLTITNNSDVALETIHVYDLKGQMVKQHIVVDNNNDQLIDVSELASGNYTVRIYSDQASISKRLIIN